MLIVIITAYSLCAIGYACTGVLFLKRGSPNNTYFGNDDSLDENMWGTN